MTSMRDPTRLADDRTFWAVIELVRQKETLEQVKEISLSDVEDFLRRDTGWHHCPTCRTYSKPPFKVPAEVRIVHIVCPGCGTAFRSSVK